MSKRANGSRPERRIATLLALDPIVVDAEVSETDIAFIKPGARARVRLVDDRSFDGTVRYVSQEATAQTRTFPVEVALPNPTARDPGRDDRRGHALRPVGEGR